MKSSFPPWIKTTLIALIVLFWLRTQTVFAHAVPVFSDPQPNTILDSSPSQLSIRFNEPVVPNLSRINVLTHAGQMIDVGDVQVIDEENRTLMVTFPALGDGAYLISWQVLSAVDGHTTSGTFSFGVGAVELTTVSEDITVTAQLSTLSAIARWLSLTGIAFLLGLFTFRLFVWNPILVGLELETEEELLDIDLGRSSLWVGAVGLALIAVGLLLVFIDQANSYQLFQSGNFQTWLSSRFGSMWLVRLLITAAFGVYLFDLFSRLRGGQNDEARDIRQELRGWKWWLGLLIGVGLALNNSLISHSAALSQDTLPAIGTDFAHILAATTWVGGLLYLSIALWRTRLLSSNSKAWFNLSLILNFSALAAISVGILLLSGGYLAWRHVGSWTALVGTSYGLMLLAKIALALPPFGIAALNLLYVKPRLDQAYEEPEAPSSTRIMSRFNLLVRIETLFSLLILLTAGILTDLQRGVDAPLLSDAAGKTVVVQTADDLNVSLSIEPALVGQNSFDVYLTDLEGVPVTDANDVSIRYTFLGQSIGADEGEAVPINDGHYRLEGSYISLIGTWQVEVAIRRPGAFDTFTPFRLEAGLGGNIRQLESGGRPLESFAKFMALAGGALTGIFLVLFAIIWGFLSTRAAKSEWQLLPLLIISLVTFWTGATQLLDFFGNEFTPARFITNPILPDVESIAKGQVLFDENCAACHGTQGRGDGPTAATLPSPPADFASGHTAIHPDGDLYFWIREGIPDTPMPAFGDQFTKDEVWHLVNYVRRLSVQSTE